MSLTEEQKELLRQLPKTSHGIALQGYLDDKYAEIGNIQDTKSWEETLGRQFALTLLKDLFYFMGSPKTDDAKKRNQYE